MLTSIIVGIVGLPLLLGVGVAFKIYYTMVWREGQTHLLQTPLTRAVIYSALTTATAFGSLIFSSHPGTASMGKLLVLSLVMHPGGGCAVPTDPDGQTAKRAIRKLSSLLI
jgi:predicted RND superfamily exporter protein